MKNCSTKFIFKAQRKAQIFFLFLGHLTIVGYYLSTKTRLIFIFTQRFEL